MMPTLKCELTNLNNKKVIYKKFDIINEAKKADYDFSCNYDFKYLYKKSVKKEKETSLFDYFLRVEKEPPIIIDAIPEGDDIKDYRRIINHKHNALWLKKAQRKFHKILVKTITDIDYLHSTKKSVSYATNGRMHATGSQKYVLAIDIADFFTGISRKKVYITLKQCLCVQPDVAYFYSKMLTAPKEKNSNELILAQGLPSSPICAFLCYKTLFDYIHEISLKNNIQFTLYVDDITFSSDEKIPQSFIDTIFGLLKSKKYDNKLKIQNKKFHSYKKEQSKKITGVYINNGLPKISGKKHLEIFTLYCVLLKRIHDGIKNITEYFEFYNLFLKFSGNLIHLFQVEYGTGANAEIVNPVHKTMDKFRKTISHYFKIGLSKNDHKPYSETNISKDNLEKAFFQFVQLQKDSVKICEFFPMPKHLPKSILTLIT